MGPIFCQQMNAGIAHKNCSHVSSTNDSVEGKKKWSISVWKMPIAIMHVERKQKWSMKSYLCPSTWASLTLIILFSDIFRFSKRKFQKYFFLKETQESDEIIRNMSSGKMKASKLINYSTSMCRSGQRNVSSIHENIKW